MILLDTSGLLANYDRRDRHHADAARVLMQPQRRILSPFVLAELDYLISHPGGQNAETTMLDDVARGSYELADLRLHRVLVNQQTGSDEDHVEGRQQL